LKLFGCNNLDIMGYVSYFIPLHSDNFNLFLRSKKRRKEDKNEESYCNGLNRGTYGSRGRRVVVVVSMPMQKMP